MLRAAIIADDLTGAADTGIQFCRAEAPTYLLAQDHLRSFPFPAAPHSLALFTNTRNVPPDQAAEALGPAAAAIKDLRPSRIYKKIDSCLRGNIGAELYALAENLEFDASFVAPALPAQGRSVLHDVHYLRGVPLAETEMARDPVSPVTESRVSLVLGRQSRHAIAHVDLEILEGPPEGLGDHVRRLIRQGARHIVFDSASQAHLDALANLAVAQFPKTLLVGSAGLASSLSPLLFSGPAGTRTLLNPVGRRILFVCGSASGILDVQVLELVRSFSCSSYFLDPRDLGSAATRAWISNAAQAAAGSLVSGAVVLKIKAPSVSPSPAYGEDLLDGLVELVSSIMRDVRPDGIFVSGGDTASALLKALEAKAVLLEQELLPGIVLGSFCMGPLHGLPVVVKPGAFGASDALVRIYEMLVSGKDPSHGSTR
jgi:uncharacterized protein YgbK (DUF1537 family)